MNLLDLPPEILRDIINNVRPSSFESVILTCKHLRGCGRDFIAPHNDDKRRYRHIKIEGYDYAQLAKGLADYILAISLRPEIGWFVRRLDVCRTGAANANMQTFVADGWSDTAAPEDENLSWLPVPRPGQSGEDNALMQEKATEAITETVMESPWLRAADCDRAAWVDINPIIRPLYGYTLTGQGVPHPGEEHLQNPDPGDEVRLAGTACALVLLLTLLPRLEVLRITPDIEFGTTGREDVDKVDPDILNVLELMSARIGDTGEDFSEGGNNNGYNSMMPSDKKKIEASRRLASCSPLEHLREVYLCSPPATDTRIETSRLDPFLTSPHVRHISATNIVCTGDCYTEIEYEFPGSPGFVDSCASLLSARQSSALETLELVSCCMDWEGLENLVSYMPKLKVFRYSHQVKWHGCQYDWDAGAFVKALTTTSLASVAMSRDVDTEEEDAAGSAPALAAQIIDLAICLDTLYGEVITAVPTLAEFTAVKKLAVDMRIFLGPHPESGERRGHGGIPPTGSDYFAPWDAEDEEMVPRLVDTLPSGVEEVDSTLVDADTPAAWPALFRGFKEERADKLPSLRTVRVCEGYPRRRRGQDDEVFAKLKAKSHARVRAVAEEAGTVYVLGQRARWREECDEREAAAWS